MTTETIIGSKRFRHDDRDDDEDDQTFSEHLIAPVEIQFVRTESERQQLCKSNVIRTKILEIIAKIVSDIGNAIAPSFVFAYNKWANVGVETGVLRSNAKTFKKVDFQNSTQLDHFRKIIEILKTVFILLARDQLSTVRQIYYENMHLFDHQADLNVVLENVCRLLTCSRRDLNVIATAKGLVCGDLSWKLFGAKEWINCYSSPVLIPTDTRSIQKMRSQANIVLIVEKDAIFQKLLNNHILMLMRKAGYKAILITGKGVPDICTREIVHLLMISLPNARFYVLTDADAYGIEIAAIYSFGSLSQASGENLGNPSLKWIGFYPSEIERYDLDFKMKLSMSRTQLQRARALLDRPWMHLRSSWKDETQLLIKMRHKAEIQALDFLGPTFLISGYILKKIEKDRWDSTSQLLKL